MKVENSSRLYTDPYGYLLLDIDKTVEDDYIVSLLQNELHQLLNAYLNGYDFKGRSVYLYPLLKVSKRGIFEQAIGRIRYLVLLLSGRLDVRSDHKIVTDNQASVPELIAAAYRILDRCLDRLPLKTEECLSARAGQEYCEGVYLSRDKTFLRPVVKLVRLLKSTATAFSREIFIHGSMSTLDYVQGFSDLDILLVLKRNATICSRSLEKCREVLYPLTKYLYQVDPLQHHGFMIVSELDAKYYPQSYLPVVVMERSTAVMSNSAIPVRTRSSTVELLHEIWRIGQYFRRMKHDGKVDRGYELFEFKLMTSLILLLPSLYLQLVDRPIYKRESFVRIGQYYSDSSDILTHASAVRLSWDYRPITLLRYVSSMLNPQVTRKIEAFRVRFKNSISLVDEIATLVDDGVELAEALLFDALRKSKIQ